MRTAAAEAGVALVTGDTKVVNRGKGDQIFITTTGIGVIENGVNISADRALPGDQIILSGCIGDHGMAIMSQRENLEFEGAITSDCASLHGLVADMLGTPAAGGSAFLHCLRDPTRGGVATTLNEIARRSGVGMVLREQSIPVRESVKGACEVLGLDPLYVANEGKLLAVVAPEMTPAVLHQMRQHPLGQDAVVIGEVVAEHPAMVLMRTQIGGTRVLDVMFGNNCPASADQGCLAEIGVLRSTGKGSGAPCRASNFPGVQQALESRDRSACIERSSFNHDSVCGSTSPAPLLGGLTMR